MFTLGPWREGLTVEGLTRRWKEGVLGGPDPVVATPLSQKRAVTSKAIAARLPLVNPRSPFANKLGF